MRDIKVFFELIEEYGNCWTTKLEIGLKNKFV